MSDTLIVIPAKRHSDRLEGKNFLKLGGKTLFQLAVDRALESRLGELLTISNDPNLGIANHYHYEEPKELMFVRLPVAICAALDSFPDRLKAQYKIIVVTLPTSPFATAEDLCRALTMHRLSGKTVMSVSSVEENLFLVMTIEDDFKLQPYVNPLELDWGQRVKKDKFRKVKSNGAVYVSSIERFLREREWYTREMLGYWMPLERSLDINTWKDYQLALLRGEREEEGK